MIPINPHIIKIQSAYKKMLGATSYSGSSRQLPAQVMVLIACLGDQKLTPTNMARRGYWIGTNLSYTLSELEKRGLIVREQNTADRRNVNISLSEAGLELCASIRIALNSIDWSENEKSPYPANGTAHHAELGSS